MSGSLITKIVIYFLLLLNFIFYINEDWTTGQHALTAASSIWQILQNYASSLDFFGWIVLIAVFDIETYWMEDDFDNPSIERLLLAIKCVITIVILQTTYAYIVALMDWHKYVPVAGASNLCDLADQSYSFLRNLRYADITPDTCATIANDGQFFLAHNEPVITDLSSRMEDKGLRIADIIENVSWLVVIAMTELSVRLQNHGVYEGRRIQAVRTANYAAYGAIIAVSVYWFTKAHYVYVWDEFVWIAGFWMLDRNLAQWREEMKAEKIAQPT